MNTPTLSPILVERPEWLTDQAWPHPIRALPFGDQTIAYADVGDGPTLLLVHTGMWSIVWRDVIARLSTQFRCVTFDAPGNGLSGGSEAVDLSLAADAVTAVVEALDLDDVVIVIHDLGGVATLHAAASWPERIRGVVAVNTFGWEPSGAKFRTMLGIMGSAPMRGIDAWTAFLPRLTSTRFGVGRHWPRPVRKVFRRGIDRQGRRNFHRYLRSALDHDYTRVDRAVASLRHVPALTVFGAHNDPLGFQPQWAARLDDLVQVEVAGGNHFPMCDDPDLVAKAIVDRFAPQPSRTGGELRA